MDQFLCGQPRLVCGAVQAASCATAPRLTIRALRSPGRLKVTQAASIGDNTLQPFPNRDLNHCQLQESPLQLAIARLRPSIRKPPLPQKSVPILRTPAKINAGPQNGAPS
jgi:hypothetical protein